ncbi:MAG: hypothetical protein ACLPQY_01765 [Streptosporangiaceae bacterium]
MADADATARRSLRTRARLTDEHLRRLAVVAEEDHAFFTRPSGHPEYQARRLAAVLAQGAALHYLDGRNGVKDLDIWTFYAATPGTHSPLRRGVRHADFGPSSLGRQAYDMHKAHSERQRAKWKRWSAYTGRRVDLSVRALPVPADAPISSVISALQKWLAHGAQNTAVRKPSAWHLAKKAAVLIYPDSHRGYVVWPPVGRDHHQLVRQPHLAP